MAARSPKDISALMRDGTAVDRAVYNAFLEAVRRHRQAGEPIMIRKNGEVVIVSPFEVPLPEDQHDDDVAVDLETPSPRPPATPNPRQH